MTQQEHEAQRNLVMLSLLVCPIGDRHRAQGHMANHAEPEDAHH